MNYLLNQIFLCLLAAFILGAIIGWLWKNISCKQHRGEISRLKQQLRDCQNKKASQKIAPIVSQTVKETPTKKIKEVKQSEAVKEVAKKDTATPTFLKEPRNGKADDLKRIKGIGKVLESTLFEQGVFHFEQIASWSDENAKWMDTFMQFPGRIEREEWRKQAKQLHQGLETEFSKKVDKNKIYD